MGPIQSIQTHLCAASGLWRCRLAAVGVLVAVISGCSVNRVYAVKQQFCDFENNFAYSLGDRPEFTFRNPVIREGDVDSLVGYEPTEVLADGDAVLHRYIIEKLTLDDSPGETYAVNLRYQVLDGKARLQTIQLPAGMDGFGNRDGLVDEASIAQSADQICNSKVQLVLRSSEEDLDPAQLQSLPSRYETIAMMGEPSWYAPEEGALIYEYSVQGSEDEEAALRMVVWYDDEGVKPLRMQTRYRDMVSMADFQRGKIRFSYGG